MVELLLVLLAGGGKGVVLVVFRLVLGRVLSSFMLDSRWGRMAAVVRWRWRRVRIVVRIERRILAVVGKLLLMLSLVLVFGVVGWLMMVAGLLESPWG